MKKLLVITFFAFVFAVVATPADAAVTIRRNGAGSWNKVWMKKWVKTEKEQNNFAHVGNNVMVKTNSGENEAEENTDGDGGVDVDSGKATSTVTITNTTNDAITMPPDECDCVCQQADPEVTIARNGANSHNWVSLSSHCINEQEQNNKAIVHNDVVVKTNSGKNEAEENTGGPVTVNSGNANSTVTITNTANTNISM